MTDLKAIYRQALTARVREIEEALGRSDAEGFTAVRLIAHSLRGSGGTYGFPEVSRAAAAVEDADTTNLPALTDQLLSVMRTVVDGDAPASEPARDSAASGMTVLLVDDDPEIRLVAGLVLRNAGHEVVEAVDGAMAEDRLNEQSFDLLLMDVMLGAEDGIALARRLLGKPADRHPKPRLVFLTGATRDRQFERMMAVEPAGILPKPFDPTELLDDLMKILSAADRRDPPGTGDDGDDATAS